MLIRFRGADVRLVLLPGMDGTGDLFEPFVRALPPRLAAEVVAYPPRPPLGYSDLHPIVHRAIPEGEPFVLVGESFSGPLAVTAASEAGPALRALVLVATFVRSPAPVPPALAWPALFRLTPREVPLRALLGGTGPPELRAILSRALSAVPAETMARRLREVLAVDVTGALRLCPVPVLYLRATRDRLVPTRCWRLIAEIRPDARRVDLDAPHLVLQTRPGECAAAIADFLADVENGGRQPADRQ